MAAGLTALGLAAGPAAADWPLPPDRAAALAPASLAPFAAPVPPRRGAGDGPARPAPIQAPPVAATATASPQDLGSLTAGLDIAVPLALEDWPADTGRPPIGIAAEPAADRPDDRTGDRADSPAGDMAAMATIRVAAPTGWALPPRRGEGLQIAVAPGATPAPTGAEPARVAPVIDDPGAPLLTPRGTGAVPPVPPPRPALTGPRPTAPVLAAVRWPLPLQRPPPPPPGFIAPEGLADRGLSPGCGRPAPATPPTAVLVDGEARRMIVDLSPPPGPETVYRLIVAFHGRTNTNDQVQRYYDLDEHVRQPTILVYPEGLNHGTGRHAWFNGGYGADQGDYAIFDRILGTFAAQYCVDLDQVFAVGHSLGGSMASSLACARGNLLRGVAVVAGGLSGRPTCTGPAAAIVMHHPEDRLVSFDQGVTIRDALLGQNGLRPIADAGGPSALNCQTYGSGTDNPVVWCPHDRGTSRNGRYYPHRWPDEAGPAVMRFFDSL